MFYLPSKTRSSFRGQTSSLEENDKNCNGGSNLANGGPRSSSRQASLFYKRQNSLRFRKIGGSSSEVTVFTNVNTGVVKQHLESGCSSSVEGKTTMKKTAAVSSDQKTRQVQVNKAKEISRKKPNSASQGDVQRSNLKRAAQNQQSCSNPTKSMKAKGDQRLVVVASKGINKNASRKKVIAQCEKMSDTEVVTGNLKSFVSEDAKEKTITPTQYKILTRPCTVPVVPVNTSPNSATQSRTGTVVVINKLLSSMGTQTSRFLPIKSLSTPNNLVQNIDKNQGLDASKKDMSKLEQTVNSETQENVENESVEAVSTTSEEVSNSTSDKSVGTNTVVCDNDEATTDNKTISNPEDHNYVKTCIDKGGMVNSFASSEVKELTGMCGLKKQNTTIKRSARLIEKKARTLAQPLVERKECELGVSYTASDVVRLKQDQEKEIAEQLGSSLVNTLQSSKKPDKTSTDLKSTQQAPHKRTAGAVTKYTQRMSWVLKPETATGHKSTPVSVGDIVWGKVHGHPWWPGKVLAVGGIRNDGSDNPWDRDAHVSWFGSSTSSIMHLHALQLFVPNFAKRHKRQKKGCYRVAVRQAQEAVKVRAVKEL